PSAKGGQQSFSRVIRPDGAFTAVSQSVATNFAKFLPDSPFVERVAWAWEGDVLRVWTVLSRRDRGLQRLIYAAESRFLELVPQRRCDFTVVFRDGRPLAEVLPTSVQSLILADE